MKNHIAIAIMYLGFFALIGFAVFQLKSAWPLIALVLTPNASIKS